MNEDRKVLPLVPARPLVEAWYNSSEGYYSVVDSPANATCQVRASLHKADLSLTSKSTLCPTPSSHQCHLPAGCARASY